MLRLLLLKFLPRRLLPLLLLYQAFKLVTRMRGRDDPPTTEDRMLDDRIIEGHATAVQTPEDAIR